MNKRMDRQQISIRSAKDLKNDDKEYWKKASIEERLKTITFLRECFYGTEATTGKLQRFYTVFKQV